MSAVPPEQQGFTLIEMLVALSILGLAALALLKLTGATAVNGALLEEQALAQIVARNIAVETLSDPAAPALGSVSGELVNAGRRWRWSRRAARSPEARIQQIEIRVAGGRGTAALTVFRRAAS
jgi:general secretion pathway protein I